MLKAKILHYGSISLITEPCRSAHMEILKIAKKAGLVLSYDPNLRLPLWPSAEAARQGIKAIWEKAEIIKVIMHFNISRKIINNLDYFVESQTSADKFIVSMNSSTIKYYFFVIANFYYYYVLIN